MSEKKTEIVPTGSLDLVVSEMTIGSLITNAKEVHDSVMAFLSTCDVENYKGTAKDAAADKAKFNALAKKLNDERIRLEKEFQKPFIPFKEIVAETTDAIKKVSSSLDCIVKAQEQREKEAKRAEIADIWKVYEFNLVPLEKIFNEKWLNKTYKTKQIHDDIAHIIDRITGDLQSIEQFGEDTATLKELYLTTLDLQSTLRRGAELRENRKRLAEEEARRAKEETERQQEEGQRKTQDTDRESATQAAAEISKNPAFAASSDSNAPAYNVDFNTHTVTPTEPPKEPTYSFYVTMPVAAIAKECGIESAPVFMSATKTQLLNFKDALARNGYEYDKLVYGNKLLLNVRVKGRK